MVYNHLKDKVKSFLQPFAESGQAVGAEDIKAYFEKLRGDEQGIQAAAASSGNGGGEGEGDNRREQSGKPVAPARTIGDSADHRTSRLLDLDWMDGQSSVHVRFGYSTGSFRHWGNLPGGRSRAHRGIKYASSFLACTFNMTSIYPYVPRVPSMSQMVQHYLFSLSGRVPGHLRTSRSFALGLHVAMNPAREDTGKDGILIGV